MRTALLPWLLATLFLVSTARAHDPPPIHLEAELGDEALEVELLVWSIVYEHWFGATADAVEAEPAAVLAEMADRIAAFVAAQGPVWIDGVEVRPVATGMRTLVSDVPYVAIKLRYSVLSPPRTVRFRWLNYEIAADWPAEKASLYFYPPGDDFFTPKLTPEEPEWTWHRPLPTGEGPGLGAVAPGEPAGGRRPSLDLPAGALLALGGAGAFLLIGRRRGMGLPTQAGLATLGLLAALGLGLGGVGEVALPLGPEPPDRPTAAEAGETFATLLANVYRAFDYDDPSAVYDALSRSVDEALLDQIYGEIYQGLVLREEGGAVSKVKQVKVLESEVAFPEDAGRFDVDARWIVRGLVEHFGHKHLRTNAYHARYALARRAGAWRIAGVEMIEQSRVGDDQAFFEREGEPAAPPEER